MLGPQHQKTKCAICRYFYPLVRDHERPLRSPHVVGRSFCSYRFCDGGRSDLRHRRRSRSSSSHPTSEYPSRSRIKDRSAMFRSKSHNHISSATATNNGLGKDKLTSSPAASTTPGPPATAALPAGGPGGGGGNNADPPTKTVKFSPPAAGAAVAAAGAPPPTSAKQPPPPSQQQQRAPIPRSKSGLLQHPEKVYPTGRSRERRLPTRRRHKTWRMNCVPLDGSNSPVSVCISLMAVRQSGPSLPMHINITCLFMSPPLNACAALSAYELLDECGHGTSSTVFK